MNKLVRVEGLLENFGREDYVSCFEVISITDSFVALKVCIGMAPTPFILKRLYSLGAKASKDIGRVVLLKIEGEEGILAKIKSFIWYLGGAKVA